MVEGYAYEDIPEDPPRTMADLKAEEAKASVELSPVEKFVAEATATNYGLFKRALEEALEMTLGCYGEDWIPTGDASECMSQMDHAKNFLALAETYFMALATPLMQAASIYVQHQMVQEFNAPKEPSAYQRALAPGAFVKLTCGGGGHTGTVMESMDQDGEILIKRDDGLVEYHKSTCIEPE